MANKLDLQTITSDSLDHPYFRPCGITKLILVNNNIYVDR